MPGNAVQYWTNTITNATISDTGKTTVATLNSVAVSPYAQNIAIIATIDVTPGTDCTSLDFLIGYGVGDDYTQSSIEIFTLVVAAVRNTFTITGTAQLPYGTHDIVLTVEQVDATGDGTCNAVTFIAFVGD